MSIFFRKSYLIFYYFILDKKKSLISRCFKGKKLYSYIIMHRKEKNRYVAWDSTHRKYQKFIGPWKISDYRKLYKWHVCCQPQSTCCRRVNSRGSKNCRHIVCLFPIKPDCLLRIIGFVYEESIIPQRQEINCIDIFWRWFL